ncbi:hypothetical protein GGX14DRAFT_673876 [Mycena pura]|uniref:Uncharacterized protein n=1 Tax=Mycena pura TaxID=153505 RepID=A0AAD6Y4F7_9AGAR|nr:hypothetical protein GGX14DRAFT_673876 [Mycena pura]
MAVYPCSPRRQVLCTVLGGILLLLLLAATHPGARDIGTNYVEYANGEPPPPTYEALRKWEDELPQHNLDLPFPEGRSGRYVKFSNQMHLVGWNNCLNERLMNAHLAYMSRRAYVFSDYWWSVDHYAWPPAQHSPDGLRTPVTALLAGPMVGGPWDVGDDAPRSISERWFDVVCPPNERRLINTADVKPPVAEASGAAVFAHWQKLLLSAPERCIEVVPAPLEVDSMPQVFDLWVWGSTRVFSLWDIFADSPTSRLLAPSPIVQSAIDRNAYLFLPRGPRPSHPAPRDPFARMLAVHVRRGDYLSHCRNLAMWGSTYYSWAQLPVLLDKFTPLPGDDPRREDAVLEHCLPTLPQLMRRISDVRREYVQGGPDRVLDVLYLLTNEKGEWLDELKDALRNAGWHTLVTTRELVLDAEQIDVSNAVDMQLARMAAVFLGNGVRRAPCRVPPLTLYSGQRHPPSDDLDIGAYKMGQWRILELD